MRKGGAWSLPTEGPPAKQGPRAADPWPLQENTPTSRQLQVPAVHCLTQCPASGTVCLELEPQGTQPAAGPSHRL